jgi:hypothetical protein
VDLLTSALTTLHSLLDCCWKVILEVRLGWKSRNFLMNSENLKDLMWKANWVNQMNRKNHCLAKTDLTAQIAVAEMRKLTTARPAQ